MSALNYAWCLLLYPEHLTAPATSRLRSAAAFCERFAPTIACCNAVYIRARPPYRLRRRLMRAEQADKAAYLLAGCAVKRCPDDTRHVKELQPISPGALLPFFAIVYAN